MAATVVAVVAVGQDGQAPNLGTPRALFPMPASDTWDVTCDGQRCLFSLPVGGGTTPPPVT